MVTTGSFPEGLGPRGKTGMIQIKKANRGLLHKKMGISQGKPISTKALQKRGKTATGKLKKEIVFAENARKWNRGR